MRKSKPKPSISPRKAEDFDEMTPGMPVEQRLLEGKALRNRVPRERHAVWKAPPRGRDPIKVLLKSNEGRVPKLLPIRYGRMLQSPFTFYRGAASIMAEDLSRTAVSGLRVQLCGDCHLLNFGGFATPERQIAFDINDFDETLPGPFEWDLKRLVPSFIIAGRNNGFSKAEQREAALACARAYRKRIAKFAEMRHLEVWYAKIDLESVLEMLPDEETREIVKKRVAKAVSRDVVEEDFPQLAELSGGKHRIRDQPPLIFHPPEADLTKFEGLVKEAFAKYRETLSHERRLLLDRYELQDIAMKVVGVGSVGTWCSILLMMAGERDPLFLQVKEARPSVLEPFLGRSPYSCHGQRVVVGQRLMQAASDIFLGWTISQRGRHFYLRQLRDIKLKPRVEIFNPSMMIQYAKLCGWALARAHARSGDAARIAGYLGKKPVMDKALADFGLRYADQNEHDHQVFKEAVRKGRIEVYMER